MMIARPVAHAVASVIGYSEPRVMGSVAYYYQQGVLTLTLAAAKAVCRGLKLTP